MENVLMLRVAGFAQLVLVLGSLFIPKVMQWGNELKNMPILLRQMFWNYAGYIAGTNIFFGVISICFPLELLEPSPVNSSLLRFIFLYWLIRVLVQLFYFDTGASSKQLILRLAEVILLGLFIALGGVYGYLFFFRLW